METYWIDGLILNHRMRIVRIHTEVQLVRGRITALIGVNRVRLVQRIDRRCTADRTTRDTHASRQSRVCFPRHRYRGRVNARISNRNRTVPVVVSRTAPQSIRLSYAFYRSGGVNCTGETTSSPHCDGIFCGIWITHNWSTIVACCT